MSDSMSVTELLRSPEYVEALRKMEKFYEGLAKLFGVEAEVHIVPPEEIAKVVGDYDLGLSVKANKKHVIVLSTGSHGLIPFTEKGLRVFLHELCHCLVAKEIFKGDETKHLKAYAKTGERVVEPMLGSDYSWYDLHPEEQICRSFGDTLYDQLEWDEEIGNELYRIEERISRASFEELPKVLKWAAEKYQELLPKLQRVLPKYMHIVNEHLERIRKAYEKYAPEELQ